MACLVLPQESTLLYQDFGSAWLLLGLRDKNALLKPTHPRSWRRFPFLLSCTLICVSQECHKAIREDPAPPAKKAFTPDKAFKNKVLMQIEVQSVYVIAFFGTRNRQETCRQRGRAYIYQLQHQAVLASCAFTNPHFVLVCTLLHRWTGVCHRTFAECRSRISLSSYCCSSDPPWARLHSDHCYISPTQSGRRLIFAVLSFLLRHHRRSLVRRSSSPTRSARRGWLPRRTRSGPPGRLPRSRYCPPLCYGDKQAHVPFVVIPMNGRLARACSKAVALPLLCRTRFRFVCFGGVVFSSAVVLWWGSSVATNTRPSSVCGGDCGKPPCFSSSRR